MQAPRFPFSLVPYLAITAGAWITSAGAQDIGRSPFMIEVPNAAPAAAPASQLDRYELRGLVTIVDTTYVTLFDTSTAKSVTIELDRTVEGVKVSDLRPDGDTLSVLAEAGGQARRFKMREAKIVTAAAAPPPAPPPGVQAPVTMPMQPTNVGSPISDEEARRRMQNVAEEIRRRREMRRDALDRAQQPGAPQPAQPQR